MRSIQGHSGGERMNPRLHNNVLIPHEWSNFIYRVGLSYDHTSICDESFIAGGLGYLESRQKCFMKQIVQWWQQCSLLDTKKRTEQIPYKLKWNQFSMQSIGMICDSHETKVYTTTFMKIGRKVGTVEYKNLSFAMRMAGGQDRIQRRRRQHNRRTHRLVCTVDSDDRDRIEETKRRAHQNAERRRDVRCGGDEAGVA